VSAYYYIGVLILLHILEEDVLVVLTYNTYNVLEEEAESYSCSLYYYMCPHTTIYVSSYYCMFGRLIDVSPVPAIFFHLFFSAIFFEKFFFWEVD